VISRNWDQQYEAECTRLLSALGHLTEGGIIESIQHIGATSVPGLHGSASVDIGLAVWPFPLETGSGSKLEALGYQIVEGFTDAPQQRFRHESGVLQLFVFESGVGDWFDLILIRDYLRHDNQALEKVSARKSDPTLDKSIIFAELLPNARQWWIQHHGFSPVEKVVNEMREVPFEWYISGGWALDLFLGRVARVHHDVDVIVARSQQMELQKHLSERGWKLVTPFEKKLHPWLPHMRLEFPRHQVHAHRDGSFIDFLLTDMDDIWRYRREPSIIRSKERMSLKSAGGVPYLAPELVLLFKSKNTGNHERLKDQTDFEKALPHLELERRAWLYWALVATSPDHAWIQQLMHKLASTSDA